MSLWGKLLCLFRPAHTPERAGPLGGFRCSKCGHVGADLDEMGHYGEGYVAPLRRLFKRKHGGVVERTTHYDGQH